MLNIATMKILTVAAFLLAFASNVAFAGGGWWGG